MWGFECPRGKAPRLTFKGSRGISHDRPAEPVHETFRAARGRVTSREAAPGRCGRVIIRLQHWRHRSDRSCETCSDFRQYQTTYKSNKIIGTLGGVGGLNAHNKDLINPI